MQLDDQAFTECEAREVSYTGLSDGRHTLGVCVDGLQGIHCDSYNWTLLVYGAGQVIPSSLKILQPNQKFSLLVELSPSVLYGRVVLIMDRDFCTDVAGNRFTRTTNSTFLLHFDRRDVIVNLRTHVPEKLLQLNSQTRTVGATNNDKYLRIYLYFSHPVLNSSAEILSVLRTSNGILLPTSGRSLWNRRFGYIVENVSRVAVVTYLASMLQPFHEVSKSIYTADIRADGSFLSVEVPENVTGDVAGNRNLASNLLQVRHYSVPTVSSVLSAVTTAAFVVTALAAGMVTVSTASLQSIGVLHRQSFLLTSDPSRNLIVFALSKWLAVTLPVEYYEFVRSLQWSIPHLNLPWESGHVHSIRVDSTSPFVSLSGKSSRHELGTGSLSGTGKAELNASLFGLPLTPMEYKSFFESPGVKPEAEYIQDSQNTNGWKDFNRSMFWFKRKDSKKVKNYGALIFPRFELFLIILALPCICQASAAVIRGGSTAGIVVGILLLGIASFLLLSLLSFLSIGITMGKLLQYKEVHQEGQKFHWYQDIVRVSLGPGKRGQWTWKNQPNSPYLTMLGPLFEDLRGPPKYMLSQIAGGNPGKRGDRIIASDDETEDAEAPFIQKLFGILRIYYTLLASVKRVALGIVAGAYLPDSSSKFPAAIMLSITSFQLFFLVLKKPFIKKRVQFVEIVSIAIEVGIFAVCLVLLEKDLSEAGEKKFGIAMLLLFMIGFLAQMINEWYALYKQIVRLGSVENSFISGLKAALIGVLLILIPGKLLRNWDEEFVPRSGDGGTGSSDRNRRSSESTSSGDRPWMKQLRELAKASFSRDEGSGVNDPSTSEKRGGFWTGKRSGSSSVTSSTDFKTKPGGLYGDLETIFSSK
ncbi:hypothetical protein ACLOJK_032556 [Asimina triloba]